MAGTWAPHHGGSTKVPLPAAQSASGAGPSLALGHQTHSTGDASSEPVGGGGQLNQASSGPGKGQLRRSCVAGRAQSGPHFGPVPPTACPQHLPSLPSAQTLPSQGAQVHALTTGPGRASPQAATWAHKHTHAPIHQEAYTPPTLHALTDTQRHGCKHTPPVHMSQRHIPGSTPHKDTLTHPPKTYTPPPTSRPHTDRFTHTSLVRALRPRGLWKPGHHLLLFPLLQVTAEWEVEGAGGWP